MNTKQLKVTDYDLYPTKTIWNRYTCTFESGVQAVVVTAWQEPVLPTPDVEYNNLCRTEVHNDAVKFLNNDHFALGYRNGKAYTPLWFDLFAKVLCFIFRVKYNDPVERYDHNYFFRIYPVRKIELPTKTGIDIQYHEVRMKQRVWTVKVLRDAFGKDLKMNQVKDRLEHLFNTERFTVEQGDKLYWQSRKTF